VGIAAIKPIVDGTTSQQKQAAELNISNSGIVATIEVESPDPPRRRGLAAESVFATLKNQNALLSYPFFLSSGYTTSWQKYLFFQRIMCSKPNGLCSGPYKPRTSNI
jgi:hypothetical protein